jgi:acetyl esterase/lipase
MLRRRKNFLLLQLVGIFLLAGGTSAAQDRIINLYDGLPPGSENWTYQQKESLKNMFQTRLIYNVTQPTLAVFTPSKPNGTALIICPGGGFHCLAMDSEGYEVAKWLVEKGVTCFVLKYRTVECKTEHPAMELLHKGQTIEKVIEPIVKLAMEDGFQAMRYVRTNAKELGISPDRIGMLGFSAGGTLAVSVAYNCEQDTRPNFLAPIYAQYDWALKKQEVPEEAPPIFVLAASNDQLGLAPHSVRLYQDWTAAKRPAELHLYEKGGHGFGMRKQNLPSDQWTDRFSDWMQLKGFLD